MWIKAAVTKEKGAPFTLEDVELEPCQSDEIQVKIRAVGICHTDEAAQMQQLPVPLPAVLGHEGAGVVEAVGASVTEFKPGDPRGPELRLLRKLPRLRGGQALRLREYGGPQFHGRHAGWHQAAHLEWGQAGLLLLPVLVCDQSGGQGEKCGEN